MYLNRCLFYRQEVLTLLLPFTGSSPHMIEPLLSTHKLLCVLRRYQVRLLVESQEEGFVARRLGGEGEEVPVGRPIALLCEREEDISAVQENADRIAKMEDVYSASHTPRLRLLEWQSYLAQGPPSSGCL
jgi:hypothetical protein